MSTELKLNEEIKIGPQLELNAEIVPLHFKEALARYTPEEQAELYALADKIDVTETEKIMAYGSTPLISTFEQCGKLLKEEEGTTADQRVIREVIELSQAASKTYDDFNLALKEPGFIEKILLKISSGRKKQRTQRIKESAITNYKLLKQLAESCDSWLDMLKTSMFQITSSSVDDRMTIELVEKYLVAGYLAAEKTEHMLAEKKALFDQSGLQKDEHAYDTLKDGYDLFKIVLTNLEKSRLMYKLSIGQLTLTERGNRNMQVTIHTQKTNSMALIAQQLRNAILDAKNREVLEGQQAIVRLNDEIMKKVSKNVALTAEESEKLLFSGFYNVNAAKEAITAVISGCQSIQKVGEELVPKLRSDLDEANKLVEELTPYVSKITSKSVEPIGSPKVESSTSGALHF